MLPEVGKKYNLTNDPEKRAIGGTSQRRDLRVHGRVAAARQFRNVISMIGSYTSIGYRAGARTGSR